jgi:cytochrome P450
MVSIVDELLSYPGILLGGKAGGLRRFHGELLGALRRCERPCSVGGLLRAELDAGRMTEEEALQNASVYALAHAPTFALFWLLGRIGKDGAADTLRTVPGALERAIKEELRIHPPVPALFTRRISTDTKLGDQQIEGGATVVVSPLYVHHNPAVWKEPATFSPERWDLGGKRGAQAVLSSGCPMAALGRYIPFGGGAHRCQGRRYAVEEILLICQEVLAAVDLEVLEDGGLLERPVQEQVKLHVYARPERDITVRATPRP